MSLVEMMTTRATRTSPPTTYDPHAASRRTRKYPNAATTRLIRPTTTSITVELISGAAARNESVATRRLDAKTPTYMIRARTTMTAAPYAPNCPLAWSICGTPSFGPWAAWRAMPTPPMALPRTMATIAHHNDSPKRVVAPAPVTIVMGLRFMPNQIATSSLERPRRSPTGIGAIACCSSAKSLF
jgi:hypothetical protein